MTGARANSVNSVNSTGSMSSSGLLAVERGAQFRPGLSLEHERFQLQRMLGVAESHTDRTEGIVREKPRRAHFTILTDVAALMSDECESSSVVLAIAPRTEADVVTEGGRGRAECSRHP